MVNNYSVVNSLRNYGRKLAERRKPLPRQPELFEERCCDFKDKLLRCLGHFPEEKCSLNVQITNEFKLDDYPVLCQSVLYQSESDAAVPALVYRPLKLKERTPGILLIGGWVASKWEICPRFKAELANQGYVVLVPDCRFTGERKTYDSQAEQLNLVPIAQLLGKTFMGMNTWDNIRAIDYLESRDDVLKERIGAIGVCWGGMQTYTLAAVDNRVKVVIPVCATSTYQTLLEEHISFEYHTCLGTYIPNLLKYGDIQDILALIAPRPLLLMNNTNDQWFPVSGYLQVCEELEVVYESLGVAERFRHLLHSTLHDVTPEFAKEAFAWFEKYL